MTTYQELVKTIQMLPLTERLSLLEVLASSLQADFPREHMRAASLDEVRGMLKTEGAVPTDEEIEERMNKFMPITTNTKSGVVIKMCRDAGLRAPDEATATALFDEAQRLAADMGLREAYHFLATAVELAREEPYEEVLRRMQGLTVSEKN